MSAGETLRSMKGFDTSRAKSVIWITPKPLGGWHIQGRACGAEKRDLQTAGRVNPKEPSSAESARSEFRFRNELSSVLTIVVEAESEDRAREELARIGLHPSFFELVQGK